MTDTDITATLTAGQRRAAAIALEERIDSLRSRIAVAIRLAHSHHLDDEGRARSAHTATDLALDLHHAEHAYQALTPDCCHIRSYLPAAARTPRQAVRR